LSIVVLLVAFRMIVGALWSAAGQELLGVPEGNVLEVRRALVANRPHIYAIWKEASFRALRRRLIWGAYGFAILSGVVSVAATAWILPAMSSFWGWVLIALISFAVTRMEKNRTESLYARHTPRPGPPDEHEALKRLAEYIAEYPDEAEAASPLLYAYSALDRDQLGQRFKELGTGAVGFAGKLIAVAIVAAIYPFVPAADVEPLAKAGFLGCTYADVYGFFRLSQENLRLAAAAAVVLLAVSPLTVLLAYVRFMFEWRFPIGVQLEVLRREWGFAKRMVVYQPVMAAAGAILLMVSLWASAWCATRLNSSAAGILVLAALPLAAVAAFRTVRV
jgi:hypothetical protein